MASFLHQFHLWHSTTKHTHGVQFVVSIVAHQLQKLVVQRVFVCHYLRRLTGVIALTRFEAK